MNELEPIKPEAIKEEIVIPVKTESKRIVSRHLHRGMTQWEFNLETHVGTPVQYKYTETVKTELGIQLRHHIEYRKDRYYCTAINLKNAIRKYTRWRVINEKLRAMMLASAPRPTAE
jgi:hypothetical protein